LSPNHWVEKDAAEESIYCRASHPKRSAALGRERVNEVGSVIIA